MVIDPKQETPVMCPRCGKDTMKMISAKSNVWACEPCLWIVSGDKLFTPANFAKVFAYAKGAIEDLEIQSKESPEAKEQIMAALKDLGEKVVLATEIEIETEIETDPESWLN